MTLSSSPQPVTPRDYVRSQFREAHAVVKVERETHPIIAHWKIMPWAESRVSIGQGDTEELAWLHAMRWIRSTQGEE